MTPKERAALQQALDALHAELEAQTSEEFENAAEKCYEAITTLREALAEQAEQSQLADASLEPFDMDDHPPHRLCECRKCMEYFTPLPDCDAFAAFGKPIAEQTNTQLMEGFRPVSEMIAEHKQDPKKAAAIEKAKMRKAEQEPVAWMRLNEKSECEAIEYIGNVDEHLYLPPSCQWLYAAPVRTKDLTDDEIAAVCVDIPFTVKSTKYDLAVARSVIAADREKNK